MFAVAIPESVMLPGRHRVKTQGTGAAFESWHCESTVLVRWLMTIRGDATVTDYDAALAIEHRIVTAILYGSTGANAITCTGTGAPDVTSMRRDVIGDGAFLSGTITFSIAHPYAFVV